MSQSNTFVGSSQASNPNLLVKIDGTVEATYKFYSSEDISFGRTQRNAVRALSPSQHTRTLHVTAIAAAQVTMRQRRHYFITIDGMPRSAVTCSHLVCVIILTHKVTILLLY